MILKYLLKYVINNCKPPQNFEFPETEGEEGVFFKKICGANQNGMGFFHFRFLTISYYCNWHSFRESTLENLFIEKIVPGTSTNWP